jgi:histidinol-phosphate aminotransferase
MYGVLSELNNVQTKEVLLSEDFDIRVKETLEVVDERSKIIFLCSPNNPSGNAFSQEKIRDIVESFSGLVVIDEAYIDFSAQESWLEKLDKYPNLVVTQTLSKAFGMAGIRLGVCYASREVVEVLNRIKPPYNVNELTQQRAKARLSSFSEVEKEIGLILEERKNLEEKLQGISFISKLYPSDANFILVKVDDADKRYAQLLEKGIVIRNRTKQPLCKNTLRFTVGTLSENAKLIAALNDIA